MNSSKLYFILLFIGIGFLIINCNDEISGLEKEIVPPKTKILNIPVTNTEANPYSPILKVGWRGISENAIVEGFWVSLKSYFLVQNKISVKEPYFTKDVTQIIPFPSVDSINKQILIVKAQDNFGNIDPIGDSAVFFTTRTTPPKTTIQYPSNNSSLFLLTQSSITWRGAKIICSAETDIGEIEGFSIKINDGNWSDWQKNPTFYLTKNSFEGLKNGSNIISVKSRNSALVEDIYPPDITINFIIPSHEKEWLIIDGTIDQNGTTERPNDDSVDLFYQQLFSDIQYDVWDLNIQGKINRDLLGQYKYVLFHSDDHRNTSLTSYTGILIDYLNTKGRLFISGWNYYSYFQNNKTWQDSISIYGNFLTDYLHINGATTIEDALLDSVIVKENETTFSQNSIDAEKLFSFRKGLYKVIDFNNLGAFTTPLYFYHTSDTTANNYNGLTIGYGYHNSEYQLVVLGFPLYYLTEVAGKKVFNRSREFLEKKFPY